MCNAVLPDVCTTALSRQCNDSPAYQLSLLQTVTNKKCQRPGNKHSLSFVTYVADSLTKECHLAFLAFSMHLLFHKPISAQMDVLLPGFPLAAIQVRLWIFKTSDGTKFTYNRKKPTKHFTWHSLSTLLQYVWLSLLISVNRQEAEAHLTAAAD